MATLRRDNNFGSEAISYIPAPSREPAHYCRRVSKDGETVFDRLDALSGASSRCNCVPFVPIMDVSFKDDPVSILHGHADRFGFDFGIPLQGVLDFVFYVLSLNHQA